MFVLSCNAQKKLLIIILQILVEILSHKQVETSLPIIILQNCDARPRPGITWRMLNRTAVR